MYGSDCIVTQVEGITEDSTAGNISFVNDLQKECQCKGEVSRVQYDSAKSMEIKMHWEAKTFKENPTKTLKGRQQ